LRDIAIPRGPDAALAGAAGAFNRRFCQGKSTLISHRVCGKVRAAPLPRKPAALIREVLVPIHPDGWKFIALFAAVTLVLFLVVQPLGWIALMATAWCVYFFRDPWRVTPLRPGLVVSPADGRIVSIAPAVPPAELGMGPEMMMRIGIFLNVFDVHVNRIPLGGKIVKLAYHKGKYLNASLDKASDENERMAIRIAPADAELETGDLAVVQIAGLVARRIRCDLRKGETVITGQRFGIIRFGSRTDIYLPAGIVPMVVVGQRAIGGETVIGDRLSLEPPRHGVAH
jgi:phosphatidylserine decarboxylase